LRWGSLQSERNINRIRTSGSNLIQITVFSCHTHLSISLILILSCYFLSPMAPRTRKSQRLLGNHASALDENYSSLPVDHSMHANTNESPIVAWDTNVQHIHALPQPNLIGGSNALESALTHNKKGVGNAPWPPSTTDLRSPLQHKPPLLKRCGLLVCTMPDKVIYLIDVQRSSLWSSYAASVDERERDGETTAVCRGEQGRQTRGAAK
jgi:hypothetical protein